MTAPRCAPLPCYCTPPGADLKAVLAEAQLLAVHSALSAAPLPKHGPAPADTHDGAGLPRDALPELAGSESGSQRDAGQAGASGAGGALAAVPAAAEREHAGAPVAVAPQALTMEHVQEALRSVRPSVHAGPAGLHPVGSVASKRATLA